jgi:AmmeMemoRadiSam system protein A
MSDLGALLTAAARHAIAERLGQSGSAPAGSANPGSPESAPPAALAAPRGAFVTLRRRSDGELRGCVGIIEPRYPLGDAVRRAAVSAALEDHRFPPVTLVELASLSIDVSVLGPLSDSTPDAVEVGRHGVVVRHLERTALLLPQVATEQGWDRETLLRQVCRKAGLPPDAWRHPLCRVLVFETETYSEPKRNA